MIRRRTLVCWMLVLAATISQIGCATILSDRSYQVTMDNRGGPTCYSVLDQQNQVVHSGVTPQKVTLKSSAAPFRRARYRVVYASQEGVQEVNLNAQLNAWTAGNILIGGVPGLVVDAASGAMWRLQPVVWGQVPTQAVVADSAQGSAVLAAHTGERTATPTTAPGSFRQASFEAAVE